MIKINDKLNSTYTRIPKIVKVNPAVNCFAETPSNLQRKECVKSELSPFTKMVEIVKEDIFLFMLKLKSRLPQREVTPQPAIKSLAKVNKATVSSIWRVLKPCFKALKRGINPAEIDRRLTKLVGRNNVIEEPFIPNPKMGITMGRKKIYTLKSGRKIILECHDDTKRNRIVVRLSDITKDKKARTYLASDGSFIKDSYTSSQTHLISGDSGLEWIAAAA